MYICIATIRNKRRSILRYRILDTNTGKYEDIHSRSIVGRLGTNHVRNLEVANGNVECTEGNLDKYPILIDGTNKAANVNSPIIISLTDTDGTVCNFKGNIASAPIQTIIDKIKTFANGTIQGTKIVITRNNQAGGNQAGGNQAGGNQAGGNQAGGNQAGGNQAGGNQAGGNQAGGNQAGGNQAGHSQSAYYTLFWFIETSNECRG